MGPMGRMGHMQIKSDETLLPRFFRPLSPFYTRAFVAQNCAPKRSRAAHWPETKIWDRTL